MIALKHSTHYTQAFACLMGLIVSCIARLSTGYARLDAGETHTSGRGWFRPGLVVSLAAGRERLSSE